MTFKISRIWFAMALAIGMLAAVSSQSHAALSTADRSNAVPAPAAETATFAAATVPAAPAAATPAVAAAAPVAATTAPVAGLPRKSIAQKATPSRRIAAAPRAGYPCH